jgi:hypothetical protein
MDGQFWEPHTFSVGDRVRVAGSPECAYCFRTGRGEVSTYAVKNLGRTATVTEVVPVGSHDCQLWRCDEESDGGSGIHSHRFWVRFDELMEHDDPRVDGANFDSHFAAIELEPA